MRSLHVVELLAPVIEWHRDGLLPLGPALTGDARCHFVQGDFFALSQSAAGFLPDQVPGEGEGEWADFFGRRAYTMTLAARLAEREGVLCFLAYAKRLPGGEGYAIAIRPYPEAHPREKPIRRLNRALEALVRECPEQYLWGYNRYKTPRGARPQ